ncbi:ABC transporter substrate-binding protein [Cohnella cholangitidis]|uniref:Extracellular solute-binding protein n=1 Tax=Cohnella cholangitidis TaxID=2598458 RepID=A0A7G5BWA0_9BACL|nr:extracellular solute-binding protein [Cohnella cholangitidis]QMV41234.1 extracellular solute-binding protein [Cohnella cholangitidis]
MKKRAWMKLLLCSTLVISLLSACSGNNNNANTASKPADTPAPSSQSPASSSESSPESIPQLTGTLNISLSNQSQSLWTAVAEAYMKKQPGVKVSVDNKPQQGYKEWLTAQFAAGTPDVDLATINEVEGLQKDKKFVDMYPLFEKMNPYTGKAWKDSLDLDAMGVNLDAVGENDHYYTLNFESVQIVWVYNKEIFAKVGVTEAPKTFNELMAAFEKIKAAGYTPLAIGGDANSVWSGQAGWLVRIYADQYMRDYVNVIRSQEQDYSFLPGMDDNWKYDLTNAYNDSNSNVTKNKVRQWKAIKDKEGPYKIAGNPKWKAYAENLKTLFSYTPEGFFGVNEKQAYNLFLSGKAATMMGSPGAYWQLPKDFAEAEKNGNGGAVKPFEYGFFNMPSMEGPEVMAPARTIQIPIGFYGLVSKDAKQNEIGADFLMYVTSPEGYGVYLDAIQKSTDAALSGSPALKDITLPEEMGKAFANFEPIGNTEGFFSAANHLARGLWDYQPSVQEWVGSIQKYFAGKITVDQYLNELQSNVDKNFAGALKEFKYELSDLETPEREPPVRN